jgi:hypothetical protein
MLSISPFRITAKLDSSHARASQGPVFETKSTEVYWEGSEVSTLQTFGGNVGVSRGPHIWEPMMTGRDSKRVGGNGRFNQRKGTEIAV